MQWKHASSVMSTNIQILEYWNKMALKYYSYSYSCHFPSMNIFGYSFWDFWTTEYIWIFVSKFSKFWIYLNICSETYFIIWLSIFNEKSESKYNLCIKKIQCKNWIWRKHEWGLLKNSFNQWGVWIFKYLNKMTLEYYLYSYSCYFRNIYIFKYLFGKYVASEFIWIFIRYIIWHPNIFGYSFVLWYLLITALLVHNSFPPVLF